MEYYIELKIEDNNYSAIIHFATTFHVNSKSEAAHFYAELLSAFRRRNVMIFSSSYIRLDNDPILKERMFEYHNFYLGRATAYIEIDQYYVENPDQNKSLYENLVEKVFAGENSTAEIGKKFKIPVRVADKKTRTPITNDLYYFNVQHLIPKN
ncbi:MULTISPECIES: hypothetical protein [unclassified Chryseobacterium]|uniref:hypothetical protein n=1 Tax=unclassified Chryseobacterium TaxID=2593645 RepID=UPI0009544B3C|nr:MULTISPECIES: hypothetical protein [unclassified Chryseobacterium]SIR48260.1 hypothetical protein SAMN05880573_12417 [Chryseobacterium sp. RU33C]